MVPVPKLRSVPVHPDPGSRGWFDRVREIHRLEGILARIGREAREVRDVELALAADQGRMELLVAAQHEMAGAAARAEELAGRMG